MRRNDRTPGEKENVMAIRPDCIKTPVHPVKRGDRPPDSIEYRVHDGENWVSIARQFEMDAWDLIAFNYPGLSPFKDVAAREVNWYLQHYVGCRQTTHDHKNFVFHSSAQPGRIYVPRNVCKARPIPTNVFEIVKTTGKARQLPPSAVPAAVASTGVYSCADPGPGLLPQDHYILRARRLVPTTRDTIEKINDPSRCTRLVGFAVRKLQADARTLAGNFPAGYYQTFAKAIFEEAISYSPTDPDRGVDLAGKTFGFEVGEKPETLPAYHVYESIARVDDDNGYDKVQHFTRSAYLQYHYGKSATDAIQYSKESRDEVKSWLGDGHGFDTNDMLANNRGQAYGKHLYTKYHPIRAGNRDKLWQ
jgi:hypothetical protein